MRYLCVIHIDFAHFANASPAERAEIDRRALAYNAELTRQGSLLAADAIVAPQDGVLIRVRDGKMNAADGPFIETKEQMAGFLLVEARDMNEAIRLAAAIPLAELGTIEVRPIHPVSPPP